MQLLMEYTLMRTVWQPSPRSVLRHNCLHITALFADGGLDVSKSVYDSMLEAF